MSKKKQQEYPEWMKINAEKLSATMQMLEEEFGDKIPADDRPLIAALMSNSQNLHALKSQIRAARNKPSTQLTTNGGQ